MLVWILLFVTLAAIIVACKVWVDSRRYAAEKPYQSKGRNTVSIPPMSEMTPKQRKDMEDGYRRYYGGSGKNIHSS